MSIHAMKRKSQRFEYPISGKKNKGFSLNGTFRNQGWVGQNNMGRTDKSCANVVNVSDPNYVKRSSMNTAGYINSAFKHPINSINRTCKNCPVEWVQFINSHNFTQEYYIETKSGENNCKSLSKDFDIKDCQTGSCNARSYFIGGKKFYSTLYTKKTGASNGAITSGEYTRRNIKTINCLPPPPCKQSFPMNLNHKNNCDINYLTKQDAIDNGAWCSSWPKCAPDTKPGTRGISGKANC